MHHKGYFTKDKYVGGEEVIYDVHDLDLFSYSVLMEWVLEIGYKEIGGVYMRAEEKNKWALLCNDADINEVILTTDSSSLDLYIDCDVDSSVKPVKQMQPHVIVRPKTCPVKAMQRIPKKRQFVTIKEINQEKERRLNKSRKEKQISSTSVIPTKKAGEDLKSTEREDAISTEREGGLMGLDEYMKRFEILPVHEDLVEGAGEVHEGEVNEYEMRRIRNIEENEKIFEELGLKRRTRNSVQLLNEDKPNNALSDEDGSEYMCPENDQEQQSDHEEDIVASKAKKKAKKVVVQTDGPRTRSRASKMPKPCDKEVKRVEVQTDHQGNDESNNVPTVEKLKLLKSSAPGSMEKYLELREQEKQAAILQSQSQPENQESQPESDAPTEVEKRKRGKSKLGHVHTRGEKKEIKLSDLGQPISDDDDHLLSEFSNFLGTTVREFVSLTCRSWSEVPEKDILWQYVKDKYIIPEEGYKWVMTTMRDQFRAYKARIKREHYSKYGTDEERLENRPRDVPLKDFKMLLIYWADEKIKDKAIKNIRARSFVSETHTVGPRSFAQVCHKMAIAREQAAKPDEPAPPISDADIYVKTRKRDSAREYKLPTDAVEKKIENVEKLLKTGTVEDANKLVYGDKKHSRSYLLGRLIQRREAKGKSVTHSEATISDQVLASLTEKIREQLAQEMEEKMDQKVRENVKAMVSKLAEKNPDLKIDIQDLTVEPTYDASASGANTATTDTT